MWLWCVLACLVTTQQPKTHANASWSKVLDVGLGLLSHDLFMINIMKVENWFIRLIPAALCVKPCGLSWIQANTFHPAVLVMSGDILLFVGLHQALVQNVFLRFPRAVSARRLKKKKSIYYLHSFFFVTGLILVIKSVWWLFNIFHFQNILPENIHDVLAEKGAHTMAPSCLFPLKQ